jgi:hypothetical protein
MPPKKEGVGKNRKVRKKGRHGAVTTSSGVGYKSKGYAGSPKTMAPVSSASISSPDETAWLAAHAKAISQLATRHIICIAHIAR